MAGEAKTSAFMLGTATVMLGPQADVFNLTPDEHSVGLVKNFSMTAEPTNLDLTQGVRNSIVYSVNTAFPVKITAEWYEYTGANLAYAMSLDGSQYTLKTDRFLAKASIAAAATTAIISSATDISAKFTAGDYVLIQDLTGGKDKVHIALISASTYDAGTDELTITFTTTPIPTGVTYPAGSAIMPVHDLGIGGATTQATLGCKIVGVLPEDSKPITLVLPKVKVLKGFNLAFKTDNYGNMPVEITPFELVSTDPHYALFQANNWGVAAMLTSN
jgi:hypothetical protein